MCDDPNDECDCEDCCQQSFGTQGAIGYQGKPGFGFQGEIGPQAPQGEPGKQGPQGFYGDMQYGAIGTSGFQGSIRVGSAGLDGSQGSASYGPQGVVGDVGPQGPEGAPSTTPGPRGFQGTEGVGFPFVAFDGSVGPQGIGAVIGPQGFEGPNIANVPYTVFRGTTQLSGTGTIVMEVLPQGNYKMIWDASVQADQAGEYRLNCDFGYMKLTIREPGDTAQANMVTFFNFPGPSYYVWSLTVPDNTTPNSTVMWNWIILTVP